MEAIIASGWDWRSGSSSRSFCAYFWVWKEFSFFRGSFCRILPRRYALLVGSPATLSKHLDRDSVQLLPGLVGPIIPCFYKGGGTHVARPRVSWCGLDGDETAGGASILVKGLIRRSSQSRTPSQPSTRQITREFFRPSDGRHVASSGVFARTWYQKWFHVEAVPAPAGAADRRRPRTGEVRLCHVAECTSRASCSGAGPCRFTTRPHAGSALSRGAVSVFSVRDDSLSLYSFVEK